MEPKKHPGWKNAVEIILKRFDEEGYGILFSNQELFEMFDIKQPTYSSYEDFQKFCFERLDHMENLKIELLEAYNICMSNMRGNGYVLLHPDDQVTKEAKKKMEKL